VNEAALTLAQRARIDWCRTCGRLVPVGLPDTEAWHQQWCGAAPMGQGLSRCLRDIHLLADLHGWLARQDAKSVWAATAAALAGEPPAADLEG
jgi:hypothetical protein